NPKNKNTFQVQFGTAGSGLSLTEKKKIQAMHLTGIKFMETPSRLYPNGVFASNVVGYTVSQTNSKTQTTELEGVTGLEAYFNKILKGTNGYETSMVDSSENQLPSGSHSYKAAKDGDNLYLTIDSQLQSALETYMSKVQKNYKPKAMTAVIEDLKTGKILVASQRPTFNSQTKAGISKAGSNLLVQSSYEPGSVFKILSLAAAVNSGNYNPKSYYRSGSITVSGSTIYDWQKSGWGTIPFSQAFPRSSNVGMVYLEKKIGAKLWRKYLNMFRITHKTGITLPGEVSGSLSFSSPVDQAVTSFGQGVTVNVMQMMQVYSALANNGQMVKPQLVEKITDSSGKTIKSYKVQKVGKKIFTAQTRKVVMQNMKKVLDKEIGTGHIYYMKGKDFGIKTGTAQIAKSTGGYMTGDRDYVFSVVGITPTANPRYCIYLTMKQPSKLGSGAETILAQIFKPMMSRLVLLNKGDKSASAVVKVPKFTGMTYAKAKKAATSNGLSLVRLGTGSKVLSQKAGVGETVSVGSTVFVLTSGKISLPDLAGWSESQIEAYASLAGIKLQLSGSGKVKSQSLAQGTVVKSGTKLKVELKE
ncbi:PASTA domain-containing protein, partial [Lactobacillus delbrueckii subsp. lactis]|nr:PASTA domain-containing protein [Lactobacillus delbrueckii subsp. lactis]